jgi:hypothetical protein
VSQRPELFVPLLLAQQVMSAMQSPKWLVGRTKVSGRRRADSSQSILTATI